MFGRIYISFAMKGLVLNVPKSHNVSFEKMRFKVLKTLANQSNDGKNLNVFYYIGYVSLPISTTFYICIMRS